jgi:hypothetical protein
MRYEDWAQEKVTEMYDIWESDFGFREAGFEVFKSPITDERSILLIGYNPNYKQKHITEDEETQEVYHKSLHNHPDGFSMRHLTHLEDDSVDYRHKSTVKRCIFNNESELLSEVVEMNRYFLRSSTSDSHDSILNAVEDQDAVQAYEEFCRETNKEVLEKVDPDTVVIMSKDLSFEMIEEFGYEVTLNAEYEAKDFDYSDERESDVISTSLRTGETDSFDVVSLGNHLSWPGLGSTHHEFFSDIIPNHLPDPQS